MPVVYVGGGPGHSPNPHPIQQELDSQANKLTLRLATRVNTAEKGFTALSLMMRWAGTAADDLPNRT